VRIPEYHAVACIQQHVAFGLFTVADMTFEVRVLVRNRAKRRIKMAGFAGDGCS